MEEITRALEFLEQTIILLAKFQGRLNAEEQEKKNEQAQMFKFVKDSNVIVFDPNYKKGAPVKKVSMEELQNNMYYVKEGSLFQRKDKRWEARLYVAGKQRTIACCKTKKRAWEKLREAVELNNCGKLTAPTPRINHKLHDWLDTWLEMYKKPHLTLSGYKNLECNIRLHIKPNFEDIELHKITALAVQELLSKIESTKIRQYVYDILNESMRNALHNEYVKRNVCELVKRPQHKCVKGLAFTLEEQQTFINIIKQAKYRNYYLFLLLTGCRPAEPFRIKKNHIDIKNETIFIDGTKTAQSQRTIPLFSFLRGVVQEQLTKSKTDKLFDFTKDSVRGELSRINIAEKIPHFTLKTLRHTFATRMFEAGTPVKIVSQWLGHSDINITQKTYIDVIRSFENKVISQNATCFDTCFFTDNNK